MEAWLFDWVIPDLRRKYWVECFLFVFKSISDVYLHPFALSEESELARPLKRFDDNDTIVDLIIR